jgi:hypothetical protein
MTLPEPQAHRKILSRSLEGELSEKECTEKKVAASVHIPIMHASKWIDNMVISTWKPCGDTVHSPPILFVRHEKLKRHDVAK